MTTFFQFCNFVNCYGQIIIDLVAKIIAVL